MTAQTSTMLAIMPAGLFSAIKTPISIGICSTIHKRERRNMKKTFVKKAMLTTAAMTSAALLTFGPDAASAKTPVDNTAVQLQRKYIDLIYQ